MEITSKLGLNPFMNQVSFYLSINPVIAKSDFNWS